MLSCEDMPKGGKGLDPPIMNGGILLCEDIPKGGKGIPRLDMPKECLECLECLEPPK